MQSIENYYNNLYANDAAQAESAQVDNCGEQMDPLRQVARCRAYARQFGEDAPEITDWRWTD